MSDVTNIVICHQCIHKEMHGGTLCTKSGQPIDVHLSDGKCPEGYYRGQALPLHRIGEGAVGMAKAVTGLGGASKELAKERTAICMTCPEATTTDGILKRCAICKCALWAKLLNADQACPIGKWPAVTPGEGAD